MVRRGDAANFPNGGFPSGGAYPAEYPGNTPRPSSPWQPDQFANRRQPRLTYRVFSPRLIFLVYLQPSPPLPLSAPPLRFSCTISAHRAASIPRASGLFVRFAPFSPVSHLHVRALGTRERRRAADLFLATGTRARLPIRKARDFKRTEKNGVAALISPTTDTTPSARLIRTWRL